MAFYNNRSLVLDRGPKRSSRRPLGPVGHRLAGVLRPADDRDLEKPSLVAEDPATAAEQIAPRFGLVRRGYDPLAVDEYLSGLEGELAALERQLAERAGGAAAAAEVAIEIKRIGEQTSAVLMAAHEQREEILGKAHAEAERCISEASATADALTKDGEERLRMLGAETEAAGSARDRMLDDVRRISAALAAIADSAGGRESTTP